jgi:processive 1,2-diacylglycerol beta-glucosyltransferase
MKKIFIVYASAGQGHTKAAQVIYRYLSENVKDAQLRIFDALDYSSPVLRQGYEAGYNFIIRHAQWFWFLIFYGSALRLPFGLSRRLNTISNRLNSRRLYELFAAEDPDIIISTHFLPCQAAADLKARGAIHSCLVTVITDFGVHPFWVADGTDLYAAASQATRRQLGKMGVEDHRIVVTGIPVAPDFIVGKSRQELRAQLGLKPELFTVLLVTGSFGIGPLEKISRLLYRDCQLLVVCARNQELYKRLSAMKLPNVTAYGFVQNMNELMSASDVVVTKPGGLSVSELLVQNIVPVFIAAIPGQETENVTALLREGIGTYCRDPEMVRQAVLAFKERPETLESVRTAIARARKPRSAEEIWNAIRAYCAGPAC